MIAPKTVLEIGVGTGRLAAKVVPRYRKFFGIDLSPKTIDRARENPSNFRDIDPEFTLKENEQP